MFPTTPDGFGFTVALTDEQATHRLVADIAGLIEPGDLITLSGDLGAGKTTFARALIRNLAGDETIEVPSPTFTLMQAYDLPRFPLVHADLYRLSGPGELAELGFDDLSPTAVTLLEWPDRAGSVLPRRAGPPASASLHVVAPGVLRVVAEHPPGLVDAEQRLVLLELLDHRHARELLLEPSHILGCDALR